MYVSVTFEITGRIFVYLVCAGGVEGGLVFIYQEVDYRVGPRNG